MNLSPRQRRFAELTVQGFSQCEAYKLAYGDAGPNARFKAHKLATKGHIVAYVHELRLPQVQSTVLGLEEKRRMLRQIVEADVMSVFDDDGSLNMDALRRLPKHALEDFNVSERTSKDGTVVRKVTVRF